MTAWDVVLVLLLALALCGGGGGSRGGGVYEGKRPSGSRPPCK